MPRFELRAGKIVKSWAISIDRNRLLFNTSTYGKRVVHGGSGQNFTTSKNAKAEFDRLIAEKQQQGYVQLGADGKPVRTKRATPAPTQASATKTAVNPALEAKIVADPDDAAAYRVYSDWLQNQGDPRGELIAVQDALASKPNNPKLKSAVAALMKAHVGEWLEPLQEHRDKLELEWALGFVKRARLAFYYDSGDVTDQQVFDMVLACPSFKFMRGFTLGSIGERNGSNYSFFTNKLVKAKHVPPLRELFLGDFSEEWAEVAWVKLGNLSKLWKVVPNLTKLTLRGSHAMTLGKIVLPELREFALRTTGLTRANIQSIATATWPELETLEVWFGSREQKGTCSVKDLAGILDGRRIPKVKHLKLMSTEFTDELVAALSRSTLLKRLETLDLSRGSLTEAGARALTDRARFRHLTALNLENNALTPSCRRLFQGWKEVQCA